MEHHGGAATEPIGIATGDFVFVGALGRPDLLETAAGQVGAMDVSARQLYKTIPTLESVPDFVQVWPGHGAGSACGKALGAVPSSTIGYEKRFNPALLAATSEQHFVDYILTGQPEPPLYFANMKRDNKVGPRVLVLDVRRATEFAEGHMPGAINVAHTRLAARLDEVPKDRPLVVNCRSGIRSARACGYLKRLGYEVVNLTGGILAWEQVHATSGR